MDTTTVLLKRSTKKKLEALKVNDKESINSIVERLVNMAIDDEPLSKGEIEGIRKSLKDIENGKIHKMKDVAEEMGLK